jgi:hypothetical protein
MSPRLRTHLVTAGLFAAVVVALLLVWWLRSVFIYILLGIVALLVYWGLYLVVSSRFRARADDQKERRPDGE